MTYEREGNTVRLDMSVDQYDVLLMMLGYATGVMSTEPDKTLFCGAVEFVNDLNATNPHFTPYEIPAEFL